MSVYINHRVKLGFGMRRFDWSNVVFRSTKAKTKIQIKTSLKWLTLFSEFWRRSKTSFITADTADTGTVAVRSLHASVGPA